MVVIHVLTNTATIDAALLPLKQHLRPVERRYLVSILGKMIMKWVLTIAMQGVENSPGLVIEARDLRVISKGLESNLAMVQVVLC